MNVHKNKKAAVTFWLLSAVCMGAIFWFSSRTATESTEQSDVFVAWLMQLFGESELWVFIVRKSAHCLEFTGLSLLLSAAWYYTGSRKPLLFAIVCTSLYAVTDEFHQQFVEGRSCELRDWVIDTVGGILGAIAFLVLLQIIRRIAAKRHSKRNKPLLEEDI